jgi:hypothetical protein
MLDTPQVVESAAQRAVIVRLTVPRAESGILCQDAR